MGIDPFRELLHRAPGLQWEWAMDHLHLMGRASEPPPVCSGADDRVSKKLWRD